MRTAAEKRAQDKYDGKIKRITVRIPPALWERLEAKTQQEGKSVNEAIKTLIEIYVS